MTPTRKPQFARPPRKTPAERSAEFDATQARLRADAAARHVARVAKARSKRAG